MSINYYINYIIRNRSSAFSRDSQFLYVSFL